MGNKASFETTSPGIIRSVAAGASIADAAAHAGVKERTAKHWLTRGRREPDSKYAPFAQAVDAAREGRDAPMTAGSEDELRALTWKAAENGSVPAMRLYWEMICADRDQDDTEEPTDPLEALDELAERRVRAL